MSRHLSVEHMHDLLDGLLPPGDAQEARAHLGHCAPCREAYDGLATTVAGLGQLPSEARVPQDAWLAIDARLTSRPGEARGEDVPAFPLRAAGGRRRFAFTLSQLAAAAAVVAVLSAGTVWMALAPRGAERQVALPAATRQPVQGSAAHLAASGDVAYDQALLELEDLVDEGRHVLAPETLDVLDHSLATIDQAIADIRDALARDPSSQVLARMLINQQRTKLRVLRQAATAMQSTS